MLERLCLGTPDGDRRQLLETVHGEGFDWSELVDQALRHQMLPLVTFELLVRQPPADAPDHIERHLASVLALNRHCLDILRRETVRVASALADRGVRFVATKGITFESTIYGGLGVRVLKDIDFMIAPADRDEVRDLMGSLGFQHGNYEWREGRVVALPRQQYIRHMLHPDHLPRFVRPSDDPCVPHVYVDFANSLTWENSQYQIPVDQALASAGTLNLPGHGGNDLPCFSPAYQFIFTVLHLFREAWLKQWVELGLDVSLMKFGDVIRLYRHHRQALKSEQFAGLLAELQITEPVAWVVEHLDRTFGTSMTSAMRLAGAVDESRLNSALPTQGDERRWRGTMRERLHAKHRSELFSSEASGSSSQP